MIVRILMLLFHALQISPIFSAELNTLYLAFDRVETADDEERNFIIFSDSKFSL